MWFIKKGSSDEEAAKRAAESAGVTYDQAALALDTAFREFRRNINLAGAPEVIIGNLLRIEPCDKKIRSAVMSSNLRRKAELISLERAQVTIFRLKAIWDRLMKTSKLSRSERNKKALWWRDVGEKELEQCVAYMEALVPANFKVPNNALTLSRGLISEAQYKNKLRLKYFKKLKKDNGESDRKGQNRATPKV